MTLRHFGTLTMYEESVIGACIFHEPSHCIQHILSRGLITWVYIVVSEHDNVGMLVSVVIYSSIVSASWYHMDVVQTHKKLVYVPSVIHTPLKFILLSGVINTHLHSYQVGIKTSGRGTHTNSLPLACAPRVPEQRV
jgi:hypothetical protein